MNLKEKLEVYMRDATIISVNNDIGKIEEVAVDYIILRYIVGEWEEQGEYLDDKYKIYGTKTKLIPFTSIKSLERNAQDKDNFAKALAKDEENKRKKGGCFIATCVYGENAEETNLLRRFRDEMLSTHYFGRLFINTYYKTSPLISNFLSNKPNLKKIAKQPLGIFVRLLKHYKFQTD